MTPAMDAAPGTDIPAAASGVAVGEDAEPAEVPEVDEVESWLLVPVVEDWVVVALFEPVVLVVVPVRVVADAEL
jgi:hypothetical protein